MKISDLFVPKLANSNPEVRKKAVLDETSVPLLQKVIENDSNQEVRELAQKRVQELSGAA